MSVFRERAERARLAGWYRDDDGTDVPDDPAELLAGEERVCEVCGRPSTSTWCRRCERDDLR